MHESAAGLEKGDAGESTQGAQTEAKEIVTDLINVLDRIRLIRSIQRSGAKHDRHAIPYATIGPIRTRGGGRHDPWKFRWRLKSRWNHESDTGGKRRRSNEPFDRFEKTGKNRGKSPNLLLPNSKSHGKLFPKHRRIRCSNFSIFFVQALLISRLLGQDLFEQSNDLLVREIDDTLPKRPWLFWPEARTNGVGRRIVPMVPNPAWGCAFSLFARGRSGIRTLSKPLQKGLGLLAQGSERQDRIHRQLHVQSRLFHLALAEAYGLTNDLRLGPALEKATKLIVSSQKNNPKGGWRYSPESQDADTTVSGAQMVALFAARNAGIKVPEEAIERGKAYALSCQDSRGGFGYTTSGANLPRTAIGSLILSLAKDTDSDAYKNSVEYLKESAKFGDQGHKFYSLYYTSQAVFRASPSFWNSWNSQNFKRLQSTQTENGSWNGNYGQTFATSAALLCLP